MTNIAAVSPARPVALITGASAGIGLAFAQALAKRGYDLIVTARRRDRLEELAARVQGAHIVAADLADPATPARIAAEVAGLGLAVEHSAIVVINTPTTISGAPKCFTKYGIRGIRMLNPRISINVMPRIGSSLRITRTPT